VLKRPVLYVILAVGVGLVLAPTSTPACTCIPPIGSTVRDVAAAYAQGPNANKVIFEGVVVRQEARSGPIGAPANALSMTIGGAHRVVSFHVLRGYRGLTSEDAIVLTGMGAGDCGFDFETGQHYLVYADRIDADALFTSICTGTSPVEQSGPALRFLRGEAATPDDLLGPQKYYDKFFSRWTGTACGRVTKSDGTPFAKASVEVTQIREEPFPPMVAEDPNLSKPDGSFCISAISPGKYLLTAEDIDFKESFRWMGYYPGVATHAEALPIEIRAGDSLADLQFKVTKQRLYTVAFRVTVPDGSALPLGRLGIAIDSRDQDGLAYHLTQNRNESGVYRAGYVPPGHYLVQTYIQPDFENPTVPTQLAKWRMVKQEVDIPTRSEIVLTLAPPD